MLCILFRWSGKTLPLTLHLTRLLLHIRVLKSLTTLLSFLLEILFSPLQTSLCFEFPSSRSCSFIVVELIAQSCGWTCLCVFYKSLVILGSFVVLPCSSAPWILVFFRWQFVHPPLLIWPRKTTSFLKNSTCLSLPLRWTLWIFPTLYLYDFSVVLYFPRWLRYWPIELLLL